MRNDGGPAFPIARASFNADAPDAFEQFKAATSQSQGMSLRDYFAAAALQSILRSHDHNFLTGDDARWAYEIADAMLAERDKSRERTPVTEADREQGATDMERAYPRREP